MSNRRRRFQERVFIALMAVSLGLVIATLLWIIAAVAWRGLPYLNWDMLVKTPEGGFYLGKAGGLANAIVGSLYMALGGTAAALLLSMPIAFALQREYLGRRLAHVTRLLLDVLWGTPSIVYGAFGFILMVALGLRASLLGGIIALTLLILPIMTRAMEEVVRMIPAELKEVSYALGATRWETAKAVLLRQALPGIVTAVILAFGRGIGDAASILFTAGYTDAIPKSLMDPAASLPLAVFFQIGTPFPAVQGRAYAAALILLFIVLAVNLVSRLIAWRWGRFRIK
jgi:phosphate transport system permease protein